MDPTFLKIEIQVKIKYNDKNSYKPVFVV